MNTRTTIYGSGNHGLSKKMRQKTPIRPIIALLNTNIDNIGLSVRVLAGLKAAGYNNLGELRNAINNRSALLDALGFESRLEINRVFKKNKIKTIANWIWQA